MTWWLIFVLFVFRRRRDRHDLPHRLLLCPATGGHGLLRPPDFASLVVFAPLGHFENESR